jgi:TonB family protein
MNILGSVLATIFLWSLPAGAQMLTELQVGDNLNQGVQAFREGRREAAIGYFQEAIRLDPNSITAQLYLARTYASLFAPDGKSEENQEFARRAIETYEEVIRKEPNNVAAINGLGAIYQNSGELQKARVYYLKNAELNPLNPQAFFQVGSTDWMIVFNEHVRPPVEEQEHLIEEGLRSLDIALAIDPEYEDAMAYKNLLFREKARLASNEDEKKQHIAEADRWFTRALDARKKRQQARRPNTTGALLSVQPVEPSAPPSDYRRISGEVMREYLLSTVSPVYPEQALAARIGGSVILEAVINQQGLVQILRTISGHPLLVQAAIDSARQSRYRPYVIDGQPTNVLTTITVNFRAP